jgi:hypothetical protein
MQLLAEPLTDDGNVTDAEINAQRAALVNGLDALNGGDASQSVLRLSMMGVLFKANHNTSPASYAWGAGGCTDCHAPGAGFYNGTYETKPRDLTISYTAGGSQMVPFTKVNPEAQISDMHPNTFTKGKTRSIAALIASGPNTTMRDIDRSELLYETSFGDGDHIGVDGNTYSDRANWIAYMDGITAAAYGIGVTENANIAAINGDAGVGPDTPIQIIMDDPAAGVTVPMVATAAAGAGNYWYGWISTDVNGYHGGEGEAGHRGIILGSDGSGTTTMNSSNLADYVGTTVSKTFYSYGTHTVTLYMLDEELNLSMDYQKVEIVKPGVSTVIANGGTVPVQNFTGTGACFTTYTTTVDVSNLPTGTDEILVDFNDGHSEYVSGIVSGAVSVDHDFELYKTDFNVSVTAIAADGTNLGNARGVITPDTSGTACP